MKVAQIVILMVCVSAASIALAASGVTGSFGVDMDTGIDDEVSNTQGTFSSYTTNTDSNTWATDIIPDMLVSAIDTVKEGFRIVFFMPELLKNMGFPDWAANFISAPVYIVFGFLMLYMFSGRDVSR